MVMEVVHEDAGDGDTQCTNHPYKNSTPGGICAFCLQEKLGKLVSSSYPAAVFPSTSSSSSPSLHGGAAAVTSKSILPFVKKKKKEVPGTLVFKRSKSTAHYTEEDNKKGFWSFFHLSKKSGKCVKDPTFTPPDENRDVGDVGPSAMDGKVSRSRSVGCGSRRFSGDFFERISTGFGDCTLRRVESHREGRHKGRVKCGGIFSGFMVNSSSNSYLIEQENSGKSSESSFGRVCHSRSKSWGWAFASPMRAFGKNSFKRDASFNKNSTPNLAGVPSLLAG